MSVLKPRACTYIYSLFFNLEPGKPDAPSPVEPETSGNSVDYCSEKSQIYQTPYTLLPLIFGRKLEEPKIRGAEKV